MIDRTHLLARLAFQGVELTDSSLALAVAFVDALPRRALTGEALARMGRITGKELLMAALAIAVVAGTLVSLLFVQSRWIEMSLFPYAVILQVTPVVAIAPLTAPRRACSFMFDAVGQAAPPRRQTGNISAVPNTERSSMAV